MSKAEPQLNPTEAKAGRFWYTIDIILILLLFGYAGFNFLSPTIGYYYTLLKSHMAPPPTTWRLWLLLLSPVGFVFIIALFVRIIIIWPKRISNKKVRFPMQLLVLCGLIGSISINPISLCCPFSTFIFMHTRIPQKNWLDAYKINVEKTTDIQAIQQWLNTVNQNDLLPYSPVRSRGLASPRRSIDWSASVSDPNFIKKIFHNCLNSTQSSSIIPNRARGWPASVSRPDCITTIFQKHSVNHTRRIILTIDQNDNPKVILICGDGNQVWGLTVGHETMDIPYYHDVRKICEGAYVWKEIRE